MSVRKILTSVEQDSGLFETSRPGRAQPGMESVHPKNTHTISQSISLVNFSECGKNIGVAENNKHQSLVRAPTDYHCTWPSHTSVHTADYPERACSFSSTSPRPITTYLLLTNCLLINCAVTMPAFQTHGNIRMDWNTSRQLSHTNPGLLRDEPLARHRQQLAHETHRCAAVPPVLVSPQ